MSAHYFTGIVVSRLFKLLYLFNVTDTSLLEGDNQFPRKLFTDQFDIRQRTGDHLLAYRNGVAQTLITSGTDLFVPRPGFLLQLSFQSKYFRNRHKHFPGFLTNRLD